MVTWLVSPTACRKALRAWSGDSRKTARADTPAILDVALVIPLATFTIGRCRQGNDPGDPGAEIFSDPFDRAALAGSVTAFENHRNTGAGSSHPLLQLHEFRLQPKQFGFVNVVRDLGLWRLLVALLFIFG